MAKIPLLKEFKLNYDSRTDVLYINFGKPQAADDSDITDEGVIMAKRILVAA